MLKATDGSRPKPVSQVFALATDANGVYAALGGQGGRAIAYTPVGATRWTVSTISSAAASANRRRGTIAPGQHASLPISVRV